MASRVFKIGNNTYTRKTKQGAPLKEKNLKRIYPIMIRLTELEYAEYMKAKKNNFLRSSDFGALVLSLGIMQLFVTNNCSKH